MFKPVASLAERAAQAPRTDAHEDAARVANRVFRVLQGAYGNLFLSKFSSGKVREDGSDAGIASARDVWATQLRRFDVETVGMALDRVMAAYPEFPPSLPQFVSLCQAVCPRKAYKPEKPALGMSQQLRSRYAAQARAIVEKHNARAAGRIGRLRTPSPGLDGLREAIADAVACAGGDEVAELRRLNTMFAPAQSAAREGQAA